MERRRDDWRGGGTSDVGHRPDRREEDRSPQEASNREEHGDVNGSMMPLFLIVVAAAEAAIGLALIIVLFRKRTTLDVNVPRILRG